MASLPDHYFRIRENGATVFRVDGSNPARRMEMKQIAVVNIRNGEVRPTGKATLDAADSNAIRQWMEDRRTTVANRDIDTVRETADRINLATQWLQSRATDAEVESVADSLLMAMLDLRRVIVRRRSGALSDPDGG